jgi:molybdopterin converting factor small subunit
VEQKLEHLEKVTETSSMMTYKLRKAQTVMDILQKLHLAHNYFTILVNGKRAAMDEEIKEGTEILILPKIAGG